MSEATEGEGPLDEITVLLEEVEEGVPGARDRLFEALEVELRKRAHLLMRRQPAGHTLQSAALVGEMYLRMFREEGVGRWNDRRHFLSAASRAMRHVLVDHARRKAAEKRDGKRTQTPIDQFLVEYEDRAVDVEALNAALSKLEEMDPEMAEGIQLRFFGGASNEEAARILGMSLRTFERRWSMTRAWLYGEVR